MLISKKFVECACEIFSRT